MQLSNLPPEIGQLKRLRVLFAYRNRLIEVPEELGACTQLEVLHVFVILLIILLPLLVCLTSFCPSGVEFSQQPAVLAAAVSLQPEPTKEAQPQSQPHRSHPRLRLQHEVSGESHVSTSTTTACPLTSLILSFCHLPSRCSSIWPLTIWRTWRRTSRLWWSSRSSSWRETACTRCPRLSAASPGNSTCAGNPT